MTELPHHLKDWSREEEKTCKDAIQRIRELHYPVTDGGCSDAECCSPDDSDEFCHECQTYEYPCPTIKALEGV
jgi:hypothetical protein